MDNYRNRDFDSNSQVAVWQTNNNGSKKPHAICSASYASTWVFCPGSIRLGFELKEGPQTPSQKFGDDCHDVGAQIILAWLDILKFCTLGEDDSALTDYINGRSFSSEMLEVVMPYIQVVQKECRKFDNFPKGFTAKVEATLTLNTDLELFGTADFVATGTINNLPHAIVVDLKTGNRVAVDAKSSMQIAYYAAATKAMSKKQLRTVTGIIVQPRMEESVSRVTFTERELLNFKSDLENAAQKAMDQFLKDESNIELMPGEKQCTWCKARASCGVYAKWLQDKAGMDFIEPKNTASDLVPYLTPDAIAKILRVKQQVEDFLEAVKDRACDMILEGEDVPGFKVVAGRSYRKWEDETKAISALKWQGINPFTQELKSPTAIEKELKEYPESWEKIKKLIVKPEGAPTVVPNSDKRPALIKGNEFLNDGEI